MAGSTVPVTSAAPSISTDGKRHAVHDRRLDEVPSVDRM